MKLPTSNLKFEHTLRSVLTVNTVTIGYVKDGKDIVALYPDGVTVVPGTKLALWHCECNPPHICATWKVDAAGLGDPGTEIHFSAHVPDGVFIDSPKDAEISKLPTNSRLLIFHEESGAACVTEATTGMQILDFVDWEKRFRDIAKIPEGLLIPLVLDPWLKAGDLNYCAYESESGHLYIDLVKFPDQTEEQVKQAETYLMARYDELMLSIIRVKRLIPLEDLK